MMHDDTETINHLLNKNAETLIEHDLMLATAESCTGGLIGHTFTNYPGSSMFYERGIISYSNTAKHQLLNVSNHDLENYGAVSKQVAHAMANGIRINADVDIGISTTGIAGPGGGTLNKPVGLVYIGLSTPDETQVQQFHFKGTRLENKQYTLLKVLILLERYLESL